MISDILSYNQLTQDLFMMFLSMKKDDYYTVTNKRKERY